MKFDLLLLFIFAVRTAQGEIGENDFHPSSSIERSSPQAGLVISDGGPSLTQKPSQPKIELQSLQRKLQPGPPGLPGSPGAYAPQCSRMGIWIYKSDIQDAMIKYSDGSGFRFKVDLYMNGPGNKPIGYFYKDMIYTDSAGKTGVGSIFLTFNNNSGLAISQVIGMNQWPITGGSGKYGNCAAGYMSLQFNRIDRYVFQTYVCETCPGANFVGVASP